MGNYSKRTWWDDYFGRPEGDATDEPVYEFKCEHERVTCITPLCNEETRVRGWARNVMLFTGDIVAIIDPASTDDTERILREEFPGIRVEKQLKSNGDSSRYTRGYHGVRTHIVDMNLFLHEKIEEGMWCMYLPADARLAPWECELFHQYVDMAVSREYDCITFVEPCVGDRLVAYRRNARVHFDSRVYGQIDGLHTIMRTPLTIYHYYAEPNWWRVQPDKLDFIDPFEDWAGDGVKVKVNNEGKNTKNN